MNTRPTLVAPAPALALVLGGMLLGSVGSAFAVAFDAYLRADASLQIAAGSYNVAGNALYDATFTLRSGGVDDAELFDQNSSAPFASLTGVLTDFGDGLGFLVGGGSDGIASEGLLPVDFSLWLTNASSKYPLTVSVQVAITDNRVSTNTDDDTQQGGSTGTFNAYSDSTLVVEDGGGTELFISSVASDADNGDSLFTVPGSFVNELPNATYGAPVSDSRTETLTLRIDPGMSLLLQGTYDLGWGSFDASSETFSSHQSFISIVDVTVPAPPTLVLAALGLAAARLVTRRNSRVSADPEGSL